MRLLELNLDAFGCHIGTRIQLQGGFNLLIGPNGAGKSTVTQALLHCLFTHFTSKSGSQEFRPWGLNAGPAAELLMRTSSGQMVRVVKDWGEGKGVYSPQGDAAFSSKRVWESFLEQQTGIVSEPVFSGTVCMRQDELDHPLWQPDRLAATLDKLVLSREGLETQEILDRLDKARSTLRVGMRVPARHPGPIAICQEKLEEAQRSLDEHLERKNRWDRARADHDALERRARESEAQRDRLEAMVQASERRDATVRRLTAIRTDRAGVRKALREADGLAADMRELAESVASRPSSPSLWRTPWGYAAISCGALGVVLGALGIGISSWRGLLIPALAGLLILAAGVLQQSRRRRDQTKKDRQVQTVQDRIEALGALREARLGERPAEELRDEAGRLKLEEKDLAADLEGLSEEPGSRLSDAETDQLRERLQGERETVRELRDGQRQLEGSIAVLEESTAVVETARKRVQELSAERAGLIQRAQVYLLTRDVISDARNRLLKEFTAKLGPLMGRELDWLTVGRYKEARFNEGLEIETLEPTGSRGWVPPQALSAGTRDQLSLAVRLGMMSVLHGERRLPLILDDPFVRFDPTRRAAAGRMLKRLSERHQVILMSCGHEFEELADFVVELKPSPLIQDP